MKPLAAEGQEGMGREDYEGVEMNQVQPPLKHVGEQYNRPNNPTLRFAEPLPIVTEDSGEDDISIEVVEVLNDRDANIQDQIID